jgi:hypothetical protein
MSAVRLDASAHLASEPERKSDARADLRHCGGRGHRRRSAVSARCLGRAGYAVRLRRFRPKRRLCGRILRGCRPDFGDQSLRFRLEFAAELDPDELRGGLGLCQRSGRTAMARQEIEEVALRGFVRRIESDQPFGDRDRVFAAAALIERARTTLE